MKISKKTIKRMALVAVVLLAIVIVALLPSGKSGGPGAGGMPGGMAGGPGFGFAGAGAGAGEETAHSVKTQLLEPSVLQEYLTMNGNIQANNTISVYPGIGGKITKVYVTLGSNVKRGDIIAEIDPSTPGTYYEVSPVYAPISGTITALPLTVGTSVNTSTAIAQIGNITQLQIKANVPERDIAVLKTDLTAEVSLVALKTDLTAEVNLVAYKNETFSAHVIRVSPIVDEVSRTKEIYLAFDQEDSRINAGMYSKIKLNTTKHENAIVIPYDAVLTQNGESYVYVVSEDSRVSVRNVELGVNVDGNVEIVSGLSFGERVVVSGTQSLSEGAKIKDVSQEK